jgi:hypothetical protein
MKLQKIVLCAALALTAFGASLGILEIGSYVRAAFQPFGTKIKLVRPVPAPTVIVVPPDTRLKQPDLYAVPEVSKSDEEVCRFDRTGDYGNIDENPKGFEDFETLSITTRVYSEKYPDGIAVKPTGALLTASTEYKFSQTNINGKRISFVTQTKKGVSFRFDGKFVNKKYKYKLEDGEENEQNVVLEGRLTKLRTGVRIAETKIKFGEMCGC